MALDTAEQALLLVDKLEPHEWREYSFDQQQKQLADLRGILHMFDAANAEADRIILHTLADADYQLFLRAKEVKLMLKERATRLQREATMLHSLLRSEGI